MRKGGTQARNWEEMVTSGTDWNKDFHFHRFINEINVTIFFIARTLERCVVEKSSLLVVRQARSMELLTVIEKWKYSGIKIHAPIVTFTLYAHCTMNLLPSPSISFPPINNLLLRNKPTYGSLWNIIIFGDVHYSLWLKRK